MVDRSEGGERVILVHLQLRLDEENSDLKEFQDLALSAGADIQGVLTTTRDVPDAKYCIGSGKVLELEKYVADLKAELVLFDHALTPAQERNLERAIKCRVLDRTGLILDIFAQRAHTHEGKLQVELAQLKHLSTRLVRGWTHLERQKGGIGLRGGPGETQLEVDRRLIRVKIKHLHARLEKIRKQRDQGRRARQRVPLPSVSLVGYTNAGKSTLFNKLTSSNVLVANKLFATLDPTLRILELPHLGKIICSDTVGFIRKLPHTLVEAFRATLEETKDADLLLHIIDSEDPLRESRIKQVEEVLEEIGALAVPRIEVYNKIDLAIDPKPVLLRNEEGVADRVFVSAATGLGLSLLKEAIVERLGSDLISGEICLSPNQSRQRALLFEMGAVIKESVDEKGDWTIQVRLPQHQWQRLCLEDPDLLNHWKKSKS